MKMLHIPFSTVTVVIILCLTPAIPAVNPVEVPKEPEFVIFASYSHPPSTPMRHSVLKEMVSRIITLKYFHFYCKSLGTLTIRLSLQWALHAGATCNIPVLVS